MDELSTRWIQKFILVNNPLVSVYNIHFDTFPGFVAIVASVVLANIIGAHTSETTGLFVALLLGAMMFAFTYRYRTMIWNILIQIPTRILTIASTR